MLEYIGPAPNNNCVINWQKPFWTDLRRGETNCHQMWREQFKTWKIEKVFSKADFPEKIETDFENQSEMKENKSKRDVAPGDWLYQLWSWHRHLEN